MVHAATVAGPRGRERRRLRHRTDAASASGSPSERERERDACSQHGGREQRWRSTCVGDARARMVEEREGDEP